MKDRWRHASASLPSNIFPGKLNDLMSLQNNMLQIFLQYSFRGELSPACAQRDIWLFPPVHLTHQSKYSAADQTHSAQKAAYYPSNIVLIPRDNSLDSHSILPSQIPGLYEFLGKRQRQRNLLLAYIQVSINISARESGERVSPLLFFVR